MDDTKAVKVSSKKKKVIETTPKKYPKASKVVDTSTIPTKLEVKSGNLDFNPSDLNLDQI